MYGRAEKFYHGATAIKIRQKVTAQTQYTIVTIPMSVERQIPLFHVLGSCFFTIMSLYTVHYSELM